MQVMSPDKVLLLCPSICHYINEKMSSTMHHPDSTVLKQANCLPLFWQIFLTPIREEVKYF